MSDNFLECLRCWEFQVLVLVSIVRSTGTGVGGLHCSSVLKISKLVVSRSSLSVGLATMLLLS